LTRQPVDPKLPIRRGSLVPQWSDGELFGRLLSASTRLFIGSNLSAPPGSSATCDVRAMRTVIGSGSLRRGLRLGSDGRRQWTLGNRLCYWDGNGREKQTPGKPRRPAVQVLLITRRFRGL